MGAPARLPTPPQQLRAKLWELRAQGDVFDHAWAVAWKEIAWPHDTAHRQQWKQALTWAREEWRSAYDEQASYVEPVMDALGRRPTPVRGRTAA